MKVARFFASAIARLDHCVHFERAAALVMEIGGSNLAAEWEGAVGAVLVLVHSTPVVVGRIVAAGPTLAVAEAAAVKSADRSSLAVAALEETLVDRSSLAVAEELPAVPTLVLVAAAAAVGPIPVVVFDFDDSSHSAPAAVAASMLRRPQLHARHAPCDHCGYAARCREQPAPPLPQ